MLKINFGETLPAYEVIPTPSFGLNHKLGGGFYTGRFHTLWGNYSAGKSTMAFQMAAAAQKMGYKVVVVDAEQSYDHHWAENICGLDRSKTMILRSCIVEEINKDLLPLMEKEEKLFIVVDSLNAIVVEAFYKDHDSGKAIAIGARSRKYFMQKMAGYMDHNKIVLMIAQQGFNPTAGGMIQPVIGESEKHWTTNLIKLFTSGGKDDIVREAESSDKKWGGRILEREIRWTLDKSKQKPVQGSKGAYWFNTEVGGINTAKEIVSLAIRNGVIEQKGAWFYYGDVKWQGINKLIDTLTPDQLDQITNSLSTMELDVKVNDDELQQIREEAGE